MVTGAKVAVACAGSDGQMTVLKEETTNWFGNYAFRFEGSPDLRRCTAQVMMGSGQGSSSGCGAAAGPARGLNLLFKLFTMDIYTVDSLLSQPARPMSFCSSSLGNPPPSPALPPPSSSPPIPFFQASACPYQWVPVQTTYSTSGLGTWLTRICLEISIPAIYILYAWQVICGWF